MNTELINRTSRAIASCKDDAPILKAVLIDCKTEIERLNAELSKARDYVPMTNKELNALDYKMSNIAETVQNAIIQRANLTVKE